MEDHLPHTLFLATGRAKIVYFWDCNMFNISILFLYLIMMCITNYFITNLENDLLQFRHSTSSSSAKLIFGAFSEWVFLWGAFSPWLKVFFRDSHMQATFSKFLNLISD